MTSAVDVHHVINAATTLPADAPVLLLSNSLGTTTRTWDKQVRRWSHHFRVIRYDTRGHGESPVPDGPYSIDDLADDVIALLDKLDVDRVHFVGMSLGGMTGLRLAARDPERIDRLVVLSTSAHLPPAEPWFERAETVRAMGGAAVAEAVVEGRWYTDAFARRHPDVVHDAENIVRVVHREGYAGCCEAIATMDLREDLGSIAAPTLAIAGADDPVTPPPHLKLIADTVQDGKLLVLRHAAHLTNEEQPDRVAHAVLDHLGAASSS